MNPNVFALTEELTVEEAIRKLQTSGDFEMVFYIYVVDARKAFRCHVFAAAPPEWPETRLKQIMETDVIRVPADTDQEEVAQLVARTTCSPSRSSTSRTTSWESSPSTTSSTSSRRRRPKTLRLAGVDYGRAVFTPPASWVSGCRGWRSTS